MMMNIKYLAPLAFLFACNTATTKVSQADTTTKEPHRPQVHFTPQANWMNDPNGMVFYNNEYHLFYQFYPDSTVWGPMHWGHATSTDLVHWQHLPIALYPDSLGYIFSGSAVVDSNNTSGFGKDGKIPLLAVYTSHDPVGEKAGKINFQNQSIAYSLDGGKTFTKYARNPVLVNPGVRDFRDPKVSWNEAAKKWIMTLATQDRVTFYSSKDFKNWTKESEFGKKIGAHGGVWECPDLFSLDYDGKQVWVLLVSINPGAQNGGSGTQYFTGNFDGKTFTPSDTITRWIDYGPDNYAGITWSNTGKRKIFIGWMSNWQYANVVPTEKWRSATTIPRELMLQKVDGALLLGSKPVSEFDLLDDDKTSMNNIAASNFDLTAKVGELNGPARIEMKIDKLQDFSMSFTNAREEKLVLGFDKSANSFFIDRIASGKVDFNKEFAGRHTAPRFTTDSKADITLIVDDASVELFADNGLSVMTSIFFPNTDYSKISIQSPSGMVINSLDFIKLKSMYSK